MNIHVRKRLFVVAAVLGAVAIFAVGFFVALGVRAVVAGPGSAPAAQEPVVSHTYDQIELPTGTWTGLDADTLDGRNFDEIDDADDHVSGADHATNADFATNAGTASTANSANTASYATSAGSASTANSANTAGYATSAGNADTVDGKHANQIQDADDYVSNAGYCTTAGDADTVDGMHAGQAGTNYIPYADASGNVGIGTTSPGEKLEIVGNAKLTGTPHNTVFATSVRYDGNLGGLAGADAKCQERAAAAGLPGVYKAWLSDSSTDAKDRLFHSNLPYHLVDGTIIANDWADLTDGSIAAPIDKTELGTSVPVTVPAAYSVWTSTLPDGGKAGGAYCNDWTTDDPDRLYGAYGYGRTNETNWHWTHETAGGWYCPNLFRLYCIGEEEVAGTLYVGGNVGIGTTSPAYKLDVEGYVQAHGYYTGDIIFQKDNEKLWRMFEDEDGLYLENLKTGKVYGFVLQEVPAEASGLGSSRGISVPFVVLPMAAVVVVIVVLALVSVRRGWSARRT